MSPITPQLFGFLSDLSGNNRRDWFQANKARYEADVLSPAVDLVNQLVQPLTKHAPMLIVSPKRHGGSVMRIYRDTRFSQDKTPYKTAVGVSFRHEADGTIHAPGVYLHLDPLGSFLGVGCWRPEKVALAAIRSAIQEQPEVWKRCINTKRFRQHLISFALSPRKPISLFSPSLVLVLWCSRSSRLTVTVPLENCQSPLR